MFEMYQGYEFLVTPNDRDAVAVSNLVAIANGADPHVVFDDEKHVHHENGIRWDNRPENLKIKDRTEHLRQHFEENDITPGSDRPEWWDEDRLREMYWENGMTQYEIADEIGVVQKSVSQAFEQLGIETRSPGQSANKPWHDEDVLYELYIVEDMTQKEMADELGCSEPTVRKWLEKTGVRQKKYDKRS